MADKLFLQPTDFSAYRDISEHMDDKRYENAVLESQITDLIAFIGEPLYKLLQDDFTEPDTWTTPKYQELFEGAVYTPQGQSNEVIYHGLQPMLIYFAYARLLDQLQMNLARTGPVTFMDADTSDPATQAQIKTKVIGARAMAVRYKEEAQVYLDTKRTDFPEWKNPHQNTLAFKFIKL